jgi:hypothetical protein
LNNTKSGYGEIDYLRVVVMVPAWVVAFDPKLISCPGFPRGYLSLCILSCSDFAGRGDECSGVGGELLRGPILPLIALRE